MKTSYRDLDYTYGKEMHKLRNAIGLTQAGLADRLGVSWRTVAGWEAGSSYPRAEHLKELIALAVQQRAFSVGYEAEEIRVLWKVAHQKMWLDEHWLSELLAKQSCPQEQALRLQPHVDEPEPVEETLTTTQVIEAACQPQEQSHERLPEAGTTGAPPPLPNGSVLQTPSETNADQPQRSSVVGAGQPQGISHSEIPDQIMTEKFLRHRDGMAVEHEPHPKTNKTRGRRKLLIGILIALVILTIIGSAGTLFFQAKYGATGQANKTATTQAYPGYLSGNGTLAFFDPLSREGRWHSRLSSGIGSCQFIGGAYHVSTQQQTDVFSWCLADGVFSSNFAFEVQLTITQGDCGGMTFRDNSNGHFYKFTICERGTYLVSNYTSYNTKYLLQLDNSSAIRIGLGQQNKIAVVDSGSTITFYVNEQQIDQEQDSSPTPGRIALIASPYYNNATDVAYSNARLWTL